MISPSTRSIFYVDTEEFSRPFEYLLLQLSAHLDEELTGGVKRTGRVTADIEGT